MALLYYWPCSTTPASVHPRVPPTLPKYSLGSAGPACLRIAQAGRYHQVLTGSRRAAMAGEGERICHAARRGGARAPRIRPASSYSYPITWSPDTRALLPVRWHQRVCEPRLEERCGDGSRLVAHQLFRDRLRYFEKALL